MTSKLLWPMLACVALSCSHSSQRTPSFQVSGTVATGAHGRTPVSGGNVGVFRPEEYGWVRVGEGTAYNAVTNSDGTYTLTIYGSAFNSPHEPYPLFIAASDADRTLTMLSEFPQDLAVDGAEITIDVNPTTTVASQMICPGGTYPPHANTWCYSDPNSPSVDNSAMVRTVDNALAGTLIGLEPGTPPQWGTFAKGFLNDPTIFAEIRKNLTGQGIDLGAATPETIAFTITDTRLPTVAPAGAHVPSKDAGAPSGGGCKLVWDCGASSQCATVYGAKSGSAAEPDATTCQSVCKSQGACTCQGC